MTSPVEFGPAAGAPSLQPAQAPRIDAAQQKDIGQRFEEMLWAEMLSHAGLEKAFTQSGGEAASAFSRFMVEAIAEDLAEKHPLGLDPTGAAAGEGSRSAAAPANQPGDLQE